MQKILHNHAKWIQCLILTVLAASGIELFCSIWFSAELRQINTIQIIEFILGMVWQIDFDSRNYFGDIPWTLHTLWSAGTLIIISNLIKRLKVKISNFIFIVFFLAHISGLFICAALDYFITIPLPYQGVSSYGERISFTTEEGEERSFVSETREYCFIFSSNDSRMGPYITKLN